MNKDTCVVLHVGLIRTGSARMQDNAVLPERFFWRSVGVREAPAWLAYRGEAARRRGCAAALAKLASAAVE